MNALCVTTAMCCSGLFMTHSMNLCARAHIAALSSFIVPHSTSSSSVTSEKSTPGNIARYSDVLRRRSHGFKPMCSRHSSHARKGRGARVRVTRCAIAGWPGRMPSTSEVARIITRDSADLASSVARWSPPRLPTAVSSARISGLTTTHSMRSSRDSAPSCVVARSRCCLSAAHCAHPLGSRCASKNFSDLYISRSRSPKKLW
mmetsp:Transcript_15076/g.63593  ORF Transcript_15076/g.63593 Transcript_15076/m.63593 type:complete len:203 (-) Transcript_15076:162-770(-)